MSEMASFFIVISQVGSHGRREKPVLSRLFPGGRKEASRSGHRLLSGTNGGMNGKRQPGTGDSNSCSGLISQMAFVR